MLDSRRVSLEIGKRPTTHRSAWGLPAARTFTEMDKRDVYIFLILMLPMIPITIISKGLFHSIWPGFLF